LKPKRKDFYKKNKKQKRQNKFLNRDYGNLSYKLNDLNLEWGKKILKKNVGKNWDIVKSKLFSYLPPHLKHFREELVYNSIVETLFIEYSSQIPKHLKSKIIDGFTETYVEDIKAIIEYCVNNTDKLKMNVPFVLTDGSSRLLYVHWRSLQKISRVKYFVCPITNTVKNFSIFRPLQSEINTKKFSISKPTKIKEEIYKFNEELTFQENVLQNMAHDVRHTILPITNINV